MPLYEHVFMARQDVSAAQIEELTNQFKAVIEQGGGKVGRTEYWGVKPLTYRIKKNRKAHFALMDIDASPAAVAEMERQQTLSDDIIRFITLKVDAHEEGASVMMQQKTGRDDRRGSGRREHFDGEKRGDRRDKPKRPHADKEDRQKPEEAASKVEPETQPDADSDKGDKE